MRNIKKLTNNLFLSTIVLCVGNTFVYAQDALGSFGLEEVVVTAQKRAENLQTVALSITAYSGDFLEKSNIANFNDLQSRTPGLVYEEFSAGMPRYFIRGIGSANKSSAVDSAVGIFVDEIYMGRPEMVNNSFFDLERVEVLRGPQGTLFGRNVVGGAISFFTRKPDEEFRARLSATYGNYKTIETKGSVSGPLSDNVFGLVSISTRNHDGYAFNETTGNDIEDEQYVSARAALRFVPNEDLEIQINADVSRRRGTGGWWDLYREGPRSAGKSNSERRRGANHADDGFGNVDNHGISLNVQLDTSLGTLTSITGYRKSETEQRANSTGLFVASLTAADRANYFHTLFIQEDNQYAKQFSQEVRLSSDGSGPFNWVGGLYYFHESVEHFKITDYRFMSFNIEGRVQSDAESKVDAIAAFANASYAFDEQFSLQVGLRWSQDKKKHVLISHGKPFSPYTAYGVVVPNFTAYGSDTWSALTPAASLNYQATPDHLLYATISRGFKSGGYNDEDREKYAAERGFAPEYAWNYEIGAKTEWFDRRARLNFSAFYIDYTDLQVGIIQQIDPNLPPLSFTGNAGKTVVKGIELEWNLIPLEGLNLYGNYSYTHSRIKELIQSGVDLSGKVLPRAPKHKVFVGASYTVIVGEGSSVTGRVDYTYSTEYFSTIVNNPVELVPNQHNLDASILLELTDARWGFELWAKNLTNETNINTIANVSGDGFATFQSPRTYGATIHFRY